MPIKTFGRVALLSLALLLLISACRTTGPVAVPADTAAPGRLQALIPIPASVSGTGGAPFTFDRATSIVADPQTIDAVSIAQRLAEMLRPVTSLPLTVHSTNTAPAENVLLLHLSGGEELGEEGYTLDVTADAISIGAHRPAGLFYGVQTLRQMLPSAVEGAARVPGPWQVAAASIVDQPRFGWRGAMLDVSRHFFGVEDVKHVIDLLAMYKMNRLHLHLSDDQGWRIEIKSWPELTRHGGQTQVGGGEGGFFTQDDYREIVAYAAERFITIVPEIDMPGHTNAALASYAELNCNDERVELYTGIAVGFSSLCVDRDVTYKFVDDVLTELAMMTPGPYLHIGGDEVEELTQEEYNTFVERVEGIVRSKGKRMIGWDEVAHADLHPSSIVQHWRPLSDREFLSRAPQLIMSPANRVYLDMKYDSTTTLGLAWAGLIEVDHGYDWDPMDLVEGFDESRVIGVEAPLWSETVETRADIEHMMFPRLPGYAEIGWSPREGRTWSEYRDRLAHHGARWDLMGLNFYRSPTVDW